MLNQFRLTARFQEERTQILWWIDEVNVFGTRSYRLKFCFYGRFIFWFKTVRNVSGLPDMLKVVYENLFKIEATTQIMHYRGVKIRKRWNNRTLRKIQNGKSRRQIKRSNTAPDLVQAFLNVGNGGLNQILKLTNPVPCMITAYNFIIWKLFANQHIRNR